MDVDEIMKKLPHRYPFLMVDKVIELEKGKRAVCVKNVTINEPFFQGHYPHTPIMPGVMIIEAMAQSGGLVVDSTADASESVVPLFAAIDKVRFRRVVKPGDQLIITVNVISIRSQVVKVEAKAEVDGELAAEGQLTFVLAKRGANL